MTQATVIPQLLTERATVMGPVRERTMVELYRRQAVQRAEEPAMFHRADGHWVAITWKQYAEQARQLAAFFMSTGLAEGQHVAIWSFNRPEFIIASTATLLARACTAPLYQTLSAEEAAYILHHSEAPVAVLENRHMLAKVLEVRDRLPALRQVVLIDGVPNSAEEGFVTSWSEAMRRGAEALSEFGHDLDVRSESVQPTDVATLVYTSGTTGPPKAVMATHRNLVAAFDGVGPLVKLSANDRVLSYLPLAHILERVNSEGRLYFMGSPLWFASSIAEMPSELREVRPTCFIGVPRVWEKMAATINIGIDAMPPSRRRLTRWAIGVGEQVVDRRQKGETLPRTQQLSHRIADRLVLRKIRAATGLDQAHTLITGAAPISKQLLRFFHALGLEILEGYGMSENMSVTTLNRHGHARLGTVGQAVPGVELRIADDSEILMRGDMVFAGYYKDPAATAETVVDGWIHTGDVGDLDAEGYLSITDRKKDLLITAGGKNVSPSNIENALRNRLISNAVVIGDRRPYLSALLTLDLSALTTFATKHGICDQVGTLVNNALVRDEVRGLVDGVNQHLAQVEQVRRWALLPGEFSVGIELTPTFKVRRKVVAERYADQIEGMYATKKV